MNWAQRRQFLYFFSFVIVVGGIMFLIIRNATHVEPTCYDGKRNGDEVGVDCGGICAFYCKAELADPKVRWTRFFEIAPGLVHAVAYIEHTYPTAAAQTVPYEFKLFDEKNNILTTRTGTTYIGPMGRSAIVETLIPIGNTVPAIARFSFAEDMVWEKVPVEFSQVVVKTDRYLLESFDGGTRLTSTLDNQSRVGFQNIEVVAILYDNNDNAITASKALLKDLPMEGSATVYFTWPTQLKESTARVEIIPRINPFSAY